MIPSIMAVNKLDDYKFDGFMKKPKKPAKYPRAISIMDEIFLHHQVKVLPNQVPKFKTLPENSKLKQCPFSKLKNKDILIFDNFDLIEDFTIGSPRKNDSFMISRNDSKESINLNNVKKMRRKSSWSVMKNLIKGLNGLMSPQVFFIKDEVEILNLLKFQLFR